MKYNGTQEQYKLNHRVNEKGIIERRCSNEECLEWKEETTDNYYLKNKKYPESGFSPECKICASKRSSKHQKANKEQYQKYKSDWHDKNSGKHTKQKRDWHQEHKEKRQEDVKRFFERHPDKFREYSENHRIHDITSKEQRTLLEVFNHKCAYCGITEEESKVKYNQRLHNDHVDYDGHNDLRNDVPACKDCNSRKWIFPMKEWFREQEFFTEEKLQFINWWIDEGYIKYIEKKPPYRILRKQNEDRRTYHFGLWTVDEKRNTIKCVDTQPKKKDLHIELITKSL